MNVCVNICICVCTYVRTFQCPLLPTLSGHINNLYNTCFWSLVNSGVSNSEAQKQIKVKILLTSSPTCVCIYIRLQDTCAAEKNELLFSKFGINYNKLPQLYRKGTTLIWQPTQPKEVEATQPVEQLSTAKPSGSQETRKQVKPEILVLNIDIIGEQFWNEHSYILS